MPKYTLEDLKRDDRKLYKEVIAIRKLQEKRQIREAELAHIFWNMVESAEHYKDKK